MHFPTLLLEKVQVILPATDCFYSIPSLLVCMEYVGKVNNLRCDSEPFHWFQMTTNRAFSEGITVNLWIFPLHWLRSTYEYIIEKWRQV